MDGNRMPAALQARLGHAAAAGLVELFTGVRKEWTDEVIGTVSDRFERRLVEETSKLRAEMSTGFSDVRQDMTTGFSQVRQEMTIGFSVLRQEMADQRFELLKWAFLFWIGQFFAVAGLMAVLVRVLRSVP